MPFPHEQAGDRIVVIKPHTFPGLELHVNVGQYSNDSFEPLCDKLHAAVRSERFKVFSDFWGAFLPPYQSCLFCTHIQQKRFEVLFDTYVDA